MEAKLGRPSGLGSEVCKLGQGILKGKQGILKGEVSLYH